MAIHGRTKKASRALLALGEGLFSHAVDMTLWFIAFSAHLSLPQRTTGQIWRAEHAANLFLYDVNYDVIKNALATARKRGLLTITTRHAQPAITAAGKRRLAAFVPTYDVHRSWDGRLHLITYDIPETRKHEREILRGHLKQIGCGKLQASVWLTPYNPIDTLRTILEEHKLKGTVIISDLGTDASIGEENIQSLLVRIYDLERLNDRYKVWFDDTEDKELDRWDVIKFLAILKNDPQLPFDLLPPWWTGTKAYNRIKRLMKYVDFSAAA